MSLTLVTIKVEFLHKSFFKQIRIVKFGGSEK